MLGINWFLKGVEGKCMEIYRDMLYLFRWKTLCKYSFLSFPIFGSIRKMNQMKTIFGQHKKI